MSEHTPDPVDDSTFTSGLDTGQDEVVDLDETLGSDNVDEMLDTSYSPVERPLGMNRFGTTAEEMQQGETLDQRLAEEEPDPAMQIPDDDDPASPGGGDVGGEVGDVRAGRLVDPDEGAHTDVEKDMVGRDVGIDGAAASAEEAAVHVVGDEDDLLDDDLLEDDLLGDDLAGADEQSETVARDEGSSV